MASRYRGGASSFVEAADGGVRGLQGGGEILSCDLLFEWTSFARLQGPYFWKVLGEAWCSSLRSLFQDLRQRRGAQLHFEHQVTLQGQPDQPESLEFKGRSDMLIKVAGQFHYLSDIEERLKETMLPPPENTDTGIVQEVAVLPATRNSLNDAPAHVFISVLGAGRRAAAARLVERARAVAPHSVALHFLGKPLPKDPVSTKVDRRSLLQSIAGPETTSAVWPALRARLWPQLPWGLMVAMMGALNLTSWWGRPVMAGGEGPQFPSAPDGSSLEDLVEKLDPTASTRRSSLLAMSIDGAMSEPVHAVDSGLWPQPSERPQFCPW
ncbi:unnamed protein product [Cladocopium goreaui]|uniref:Uncharacterized protein n=1 Tax=Cladocopium goreaui TaxID=2562237 RepID=A0A9P1D5X9_9DINO|nr:unnamed protein product [Cladocopium goreaui]